MSCIDFVFGSNMDFRQYPYIYSKLSKYTDIITAVNKYDIRILELAVSLLKNNHLPFYKTQTR